MRFTPETDPTEMPRNGSGKLSARAKGKGTQYHPGEGPKGSGGGSSLGPNGTSIGPAGKSLVDFTGKPKPVHVKQLPNIRDASTPGKQKRS